MTRACAAVLLATVLCWSCSQERAASPQPAAPVATTQASERSDEPVAVVKAYYDAINARDYRRAYSYWGPSGPPQTFEQFEKGFADTATVSVTPGEPSRVEGAAGSRYIDIPVTIIATKKSGGQQTFTGTYTLRRTAVDGAPAEAKRWHINGASIHATP